jgi:hypothetical protein
MTRTSRLKNAHGCLKGRRYLSAFLAFWVFVLSLAGVNPALHEALHTKAGVSSCENQGAPCDSQPTENTEENHFCAVTLLQGSVGLWIAPQIAHVSEISIADLRIDAQQTYTHASEQTHRSRAPPIEKLV